MATELADRLATIRRVFPIDTILGRDAADDRNIARYYRANRLAYQFVNSRQGFVHMGITPEGGVSAG